MSDKPVCLANFAAHTIQHQAQLLRHFAVDPAIDLTGFFTAVFSLLTSFSGPHPDDRRGRKYLKIIDVQNFNAGAGSLRDAPHFYFSDRIAARE